MAPAFSFSYLDSLGSSPVAAAPPAAAAPSNGASYLDALNPAAPAAPVAAAAPAPTSTFSVFADMGGEVATTSAGYLDSVNVGSAIDGPGLMTHVDTLNTGQGLMGGAGIHRYADELPVSSDQMYGAGIHTHVDGLSPTSAIGGSASSADGVAFTLETGDISGLVQDLSAGGTLRLTGSINNISYN